MSKSNIHPVGPVRKLIENNLPGTPDNYDFKIITFCTPTEYKEAHTEEEYIDWLKGIAKKNNYPFDEFYIFVEETEALRNKTFELISKQESDRKNYHTYEKEIKKIWKTRDKLKSDFYGKYDERHKKYNKKKRK